MRRALEKKEADHLVRDTTTRQNAQEAPPQQRKIVVNCLFLLPAVVLIGVYIVYPIINSFYISMFDWNGLDPVKKFVGLANWEKLLHDPIFGKAVLNNIYIVVLSIVIQLPLGMIVAILLTETKHFAKLLKRRFSCRC